MEDQTTLPPPPPSPSPRQTETSTTTNTGNTTSNTVSTTSNTVAQNVASKSSTASLGSVSISTDTVDGAVEKKGRFTIRDFHVSQERNEHHDSNSQTQPSEVKQQQKAMKATSSLSTTTPGDQTVPKAEKIGRFTFYDVTADSSSTTTGSNSNAPKDKDELENGKMESKSPYPNNSTSTSTNQLLMKDGGIDNSQMNGKEAIRNENPKGTTISLERNTNSNLTNFSSISGIDAHGQQPQHTLTANESIYNITDRYNHNDNNINNHGISQNGSIGNLHNTNNNNNTHSLESQNNNIYIQNKNILRETSTSSMNSTLTTRSHGGYSHHNQMIDVNHFPPIQQSNINNSGQSSNMPPPMDIKKYPSSGSLLSDSNASNISPTSPDHQESYHENHQYYGNTYQHHINLGNGTMVAGDVLTRITRTNETILHKLALMEKHVMHNNIQYTGNKSSTSNLVDQLPQLNNSNSSGSLGSSIAYSHNDVSQSMSSFGTGVPSNNKASNTHSNLTSKLYDHIEHMKKDVDIVKDVFVENKALRDNLSKETQKTERKFQEEKKKRIEHEKTILELREENNSLINTINNLRHEIKNLQLQLSQSQQQQQSSAVVLDKARSDSYLQLNPNQDPTLHRLNSFGSIGSQVGSVSSTNTSPLSAHGANYNSHNQNIIDENQQSRQNESTKGPTLPIQLARRASKEKNEYYPDDNSTTGMNSQGNTNANTNNRTTSTKPNQSPVQQLHLEINLSTIEHTYSNPNLGLSNYPPSTGSSSQANSLVTTPVITPTNNSTIQGNRNNNNDTASTHGGHASIPVAKDNTIANNNNNQSITSQSSQPKNSTLVNVNGNGGNQNNAQTMNSSSHRSHAYQSRRDSATRALHGTPSLSQMQTNSLGNSTNTQSDQRHNSLTLTSHSKSMINVNSGKNLTATPMKAISSNLEIFEGVEKKKHDQDDDAFKGLYAQSKTSFHSRKNKSNSDLQSIVKNEGEK